MPAVTDQSDVRTLIPRMRRALDGPHATSSAAVSSTMNDDEVAAKIADSIAEVIFYTNGGWGRELIVTERDANYLAPINWKTDEPLSDAEATAIIAQAALTYFYYGLNSLKTSEHIVNEGEEWEWQTSAQAVAERIKQLKAMRDEALALLGEGGQTAEDWVNLLEVRDAYTDALIEPWTDTGIGGQFFDPRFGTIG